MMDPKPRSQLSIFSGLSWAEFVGKPIHLPSGNPILTLNSLPGCVPNPTDVAENPNNNILSSPHPLQPLKPKPKLKSQLKLKQLACHRPLTSKRKWGRRTINSQIASAYNDFLMEEQLGELKFKGSRFTWSNKHQVPSRVMERIDKVVVSLEWKMLFPYCQLFHDKLLASDHRPLVLVLLSKVRKPRRTFNFDLRWTTSNNCDRVVAQAWQQVDSTEPFQTKLMECRRMLSSWSAQEFGNARWRIQELSKQLDMLQSYPRGISSLKRLIP
ncbi:hypothetical protein GH714_018740 [Hevea brasiliensis]|uniref:Endonuclease/exonuclease/phosphatase domain-containing protein n=1 Tax=Hevea brasiliensis TaxID=3981 RepID=A0A6A6MB59_HEVBR|nr:hypothetical protein GH714_018740 [Hevea brasiliensis]